MTYFTVPLDGFRSILGLLVLDPTLHSPPDAHKFERTSTMSNTSSPVFSPSCPNGGDYYACGNGAKFVGCCTSDPCNDAGCSAGNLRTMSFDPAYWGTPQMPDQQCAVAGQQWWSCSATVCLSSSARLTLVSNMHRILPSSVVVQSIPALPGVPRPT